jgi:hypothetical protein
MRRISRRYAIADALKFTRFLWWTVALMRPRYTVV